MITKPLSPSAIAERIAENTGVVVGDVKKVLQAQAELAYSQSDSGFIIPGIGVLRKVERPARTGIMPFGPNRRASRPIAW